MKRTPRICLFLSLILLAIAALALPAAGPLTGASAQGEVKRWVIIYHQHNSVPQDAERSVGRAGGTVTARLNEIGAVVAESSNPDFAAAMAHDPKVSSVA